MSLLFYGLETLSRSAILFLPGYLIDHYTEGWTTISFLVLIYFLLFLTYLLIAYCSNRLSDIRRVKFEENVKKAFFNAVIEQDYQQYHRHEIGEYLSMQANDITEMCQNYLSPLLSIFRSIIMIFVFGISLVIFVDISIAVAIILFSIVVVFVPNITASQLSDRNDKYLKSVGKYTSTAKSFLEARDILDGKSIKNIERVHDSELESVLSANMYFRKLNSLALVLNGGSVEFVSVMCFVIIAALLFLDKITIGMAMAAFMYSTKFNDPIYELNVCLGKVKSVKQIQDKLNYIINQKIEVAPSSPCSVREINVHDVRKSFKNVKVEISNMKLVYPNKYLIVGDNGAGKSVLFRMLMGFYNPDEGEIQYDGINNINVSFLNAYVPQQPIIFDTDYSDNVTLYGTYDESNLCLYESYFPSEIINCVKAAISCINLSGGEKQVIALIRVLCSCKPVILLDEPFSAMNRTTIECFLANLDALNRMVVVIAHNADEYANMFDRTYYITRKKTCKGWTTL